MGKTYTTIAGDKWDSIAYKTMGDCLKMDLLIKANLKYKDIFIFPAGITLNIPEIKKEKRFTLPPWKRKRGNDE